MPPSSIDQRLFDAGAVALAALGTVLTLTGWASAATTEGPAWWWVDLAGGVLCALLLLARRRAPVGVAVAVWAVGAVAVSPWLAAAVATFGLAVRRSWPVSVTLGALSLVGLPISWLIRTMRPDAEPSWSTAGWVVLVTALVVASGVAVRARQELMASLVERAERAEREAALRAQSARAAERTRIAREMHDVLAHRLSLVSMHAGALAHRHHPSPDEVAEALEVIRGGARDALTDLRTILGVLRDPTTGESGVETADHAPQPTLDDLERLLAGVRATGTVVDLHDAIADRARLPADAGRALFRVTQEALTNAARHAPGLTVTVRLCGSPGATADIEVVNALPAIRPPGPAGGAGTGLVGISERVGLAGGRVVAAGPEDGRFRVAVRLPWPADGRASAEVAGP